MRDFKEILNEVHEQATKDNCQSWNVICQLAMEKTVEEYKSEIIEQLQKISNNYEVVGGCYVIQKTTFNNYIENLEAFGSIF